MKVNTRKLRTTESITILGNEPWLDAIYALFDHDKSHSDSAAKSLLTGSLQIIPQAIALGFKVEGQLQYAPLLPCNLCSKNISWPLVMDINVFYRHENSNLEETTATPGQEKLLSKEELDYYFLEDDQIDIELLINEQVQLAVPARTVKASEDNSHCTICLEPLLNGNALYSTNKNENNSPFAILAELKPKM